jgi:hypothetical protein
MHESVFLSRPHLFSCSNPLHLVLSNRERVNAIWTIYKRSVQFRFRRLVTKKAR